MSRHPQVIITDFITEPLDIERAVFGGAAEVRALEAKSEAELAGQVEQADILMVYHLIKLGAETIGRLENCKLIARPGVGFDNVDIQAARARRIPVVNVPDYGTEEVADTAIGMLLTLSRGIHLLNRRLQAGAGDWTYRHAVPLGRLRGRVFGVVGLGRIGTAAALRAKALGMEVLFHDPYVPDGRDKAIGVTRVDTLEELLTRSYALSLHCPLTEETRGLIGETELAAMPEGGFLVNTARGDLVAMDAVLSALESGRLAGAGIDVLETEPPDPESRLIRSWRDPAHPAHERLILNPHAAFYCEEGIAEFRRKGSQNALRALRGEPLRNVVN